MCCFRSFLNIRMEDADCSDIGNLFHSLGPAVDRNDAVRQLFFAYILCTNYMFMTITSVIRMYVFGFREIMCIQWGGIKLNIDMYLSICTYIGLVSCNNSCAVVLFLFIRLHAAEEAEKNSVFE